VTVCISRHCRILAFQFEEIFSPENTQFLTVLGLMLAVLLDRCVKLCNFCNCILKSQINWLLSIDRVRFIYRASGFQKRMEKWLLHRTYMASISQLVSTLHLFCVLTSRLTIIFVSHTEIVSR
jgi:hypothetical protein